MLGDRIALEFVWPFIKHKKLFFNHFDKIDYMHYNIYKLNKQTYYQ